MKIRLDASLKREFYSPAAVRIARLWINQGKMLSSPVKVDRPYATALTGMESSK